MLRASQEVREIIVSLAEADSTTWLQLRQLGATCLEGNEPNRGRQLDAGAAVATGRWILFHHADSQITPEHLQALAALDVEKNVVGGAFYRRFDQRHPALRRFEPVERWHNRSFGPLYGDQSLFARREVFTALGGFRGLPLMEDVNFSLRLRRAGRVVVLDPPMASSPRRHLARGPWRTTLLNAMLLLLFRVGVSPRRLHTWYYGQSASRQIAGAHPFGKQAQPFPAELKLGCRLDDSTVQHTLTL